MARKNQILNSSVETLYNYGILFNFCFIFYINLVEFGPSDVIICKYIVFYNRKYYCNIYIVIYIIIIGWLKIIYILFFIFKFLFLLFIFLAFI